jgi:hypothetical protein
MSRTNDAKTAQQERDLRHGARSQPENAKDTEGETSAERVESDVRSNDGIGGVFRGRVKSETEEALQRTRRPQSRSGGQFR